VREGCAEAVPRNVILMFDIAPVRSRRSRYNVVHDQVEIDLRVKNIGLYKVELYRDVRVLVPFIYLAWAFPETK
jgi:hypothetical protein